MAKKSTKDKQSNKPDTSSIFDRIKPVADHEFALNCLFYGRSGSGKTTLSSTFPKPILIVDIREQGVGSVGDVEDVDYITVEEWTDVEDLYWALESGKLDYKTLVIDTITQAQDLAINHVKQEKGVDQMTQQMWGIAGGLLKQYLMAFRDLESLNVIFLAQDKTMDNSDDEGSTDQVAPSVGPMLMPSVAKGICAGCSVIGNTYIKEQAKQKEGKIVKTMNYELRLGPHSVYTTKIRSPRSFKVPGSIRNPSYEKIMEIIKGEYATEK